MPCTGSGCRSLEVKVPMRVPEFDGDGGNANGSNTGPATPGGPQWMCASLIGVLKLANGTAYETVLFVVSKVTRALPVALLGLGGVSCAPVRWGALNVTRAACAAGARPSVARTAAHATRRDAANEFFIEVSQ